MKFKKILVPYDGSDPSKRALDVACDLMRDSATAQMCVLTIVPVPPTAPESNYKRGFRRPRKTKTPVALMTSDDYEDVVLQALDDGYRNLQEEVGPLIAEFGDRAKADATANLAPSNGIIDYAHDNGCDLIVMGRRGLGKVKQALLGSVSTGVLRNAQTAVLTIK